MPLTCLDKETTTTDTQSDTPERTPRGNSLAFALGQFSAEIKNHTRQLDQLPSQVVEMLSPRFIALETAKSDHETRIRGLERWRWIIVGGGAALWGIAELVSYRH